MKEALRLMIRKHEALRTHFIEENDNFLSLEKVLRYGLSFAQSSGSPMLASDITTALQNVLALRSEMFNDDEIDKMLAAKSDPDSDLLHEVYAAYVQMNNSAVKVQRNCDRLVRALEAIELQHASLTEQIDTWRAYLDNVKAQAMRSTPTKGAKAAQSTGTRPGLEKQEKQK